MAIVKDYTVAYWADLFASLASDLPVERLNAWLAEESRGFPQSIGGCYEVGIFQINLGDAPHALYGGNMQTLHADFCSAYCGGSRTRDLTDDEEALQVTSGCAMVREYHNSAQSQAPSWSDDDQWCLTKLHHGLPFIANTMLSHAQAAGQADDWPMFRAYACGLSNADIAAINANVAANKNYWPFDRFFDNAEKVGYVTGGGLVGGGGLSQLGKAVLALLALAGALYYGGLRGLV